MTREGLAKQAEMVAQEYGRQTGVDLDLNVLMEALSGAALLSAEPDAVIATERSEQQAVAEVYLRGTAAWHQYVHGGNHTDWAPVYFGNPSDCEAA